VNGSTPEKSRESHVAAPVLRDLPPRVTHPTPVEFVEDTRTWLRWISEQVEAGLWSAEEQVRMTRTMLADALDYIERRAK